jgi:hypothetical protein
MRMRVDHRPDPVLGLACADFALLVDVTERMRRLPPVRPGNVDRSVLSGRFHDATSGKCTPP